MKRSSLILKLVAGAILCFFNTFSSASAQQPPNSQITVTFEQTLLGFRNNVDTVVEARISGTDGDDIILATVDGDEVEIFDGNSTTVFTAPPRVIIGTRMRSIYGFIPTVFVDSKGGDDFVWIRSVDPNQPLARQNIILGDGDDTFNLFESTPEVNVEGGDGNDRIVSRVEVPGSIFNGGDGDDTLIGAVRSTGGAGNDVITSSSLADTTGSLGNLTLLRPIRGITGDDGNDVLTGLGGNDSINGGNGNDFISGGAGDDAIWGGNGRDLIYGGDGDDDIGGDLGFGFGIGIDTVYGGPGNDIIRGGGGADMLFGQEGNDTIRGDAGNDSVSGGAGDDSLRGGSGVDSLLGGCLLYTSPSPRDKRQSRMPSSA